MKVPQTPTSQSSNGARPQDFIGRIQPHQPPVNPTVRPDLPNNQNAGAVRPIVAAPPVVPMPRGGQVTAPPPFVSIPEPKRTPRG
jgi:hypothetical protein